MHSFEFDPKKSESSRKKHGVGFVDVQIGWQNIDFIEIQAKSAGESRSLVWRLSPTVQKRYVLFLSGSPVNQRWHCMQAKSLDKKFDENKLDVIDELGLIIAVWFLKSDL